MLSLMRFRRAAIPAIVFAALIIVWLFWNRPQRVDMAGYVPADSLAFLEVNDLPGIAQGIVSTDAWRTLSKLADANLHLPGGSWPLSIARWTGIGPTEAVLLARSQFAVSVIGFEQGDAGPALPVKPVSALVIETHTSQFRMRSVFERQIAQFAQRLFGKPQLQHKTVDGVDFLEWSSPDGAHQVVTAFVGTAVIIGNDERPVRACIAVRNGEQASLASTELLNKMRGGAATGDAPLFGFLSSTGLRSLLPYLFGQSSASTNLPQILARVAASLAQGIAWSPRFLEGAVEDRYLCLLADGVAPQLKDGVLPERRVTLRFTDLLPPDTNSFTQYNLRQPDEAWRGLNTAVSLHADAVSSLIARQALAGVLKNYGIDDADTFLRSVGPEIATVRLNENGAPLVIAETFDASALRKLMNARLGGHPSTERIGDAEMSVSRDLERRAASFTGNDLVIGLVDDVRRCLQARAQSHSLAANDSFQKAQILLNPSIRNTAITFTSDENAAGSFVLLFSENRTVALSGKAAALSEAGKRLPYAVTVTQLGENAFHRTTRSSFGLLGNLIVQFAPGDLQ
jgi:hypothetical protein